MINQELTEKMINLKEGRFLNICSFYADFSNIESGGEINYSVSSCFKNFINEYVDDFLDISFMLSALFKEKIEKESIDIGSEVLLIKVIVKPSEYGFCISFKSDYINELVNIEKRSGINNRINNLSELLTSKINKIIDINVEKIDVGEMKNFKLIYKNMSDKINIYDFIHKSDRPVREQEKDVAKLIFKDIDKKVYQKAKDSGYDLRRDTIIIDFDLIDNKNIENLKVGYIEDDVIDVKPPSIINNEINFKKWNKGEMIECIFHSYHLLNELDLEETGVIPIIDIYYKEAEKVLKLKVYRGGEIEEDDGFKKIETLSAKNIDGVSDDCELIEDIEFDIDDIREFFYETLALEEDGSDDYHSEDIDTDDECEMEEFIGTTQMFLHKYKRMCSDYYCYFKDYTDGLDINHILLDI